MTLDVNMVTTGYKDRGGVLALGEQDTVGVLYDGTGMLSGMSSVTSVRICTCATDALQSLRSSVLGVSAKLWKNAVRVNHRRIYIVGECHVPGFGSYRVVREDCNGSGD